MVTIFIWAAGSLRSSSGYTLYSLRSCRSYPCRDRTSGRCRYNPFCHGDTGWSDIIATNIMAIVGANNHSPLQAVAINLPKSASILPPPHRCTPSGVQEPVEPKCPQCHHRTPSGVRGKIPPPPPFRCRRQEATESQ